MSLFCRKLAFRTFLVWMDGANNPLFVLLMYIIACMDGGSEWFRIECTLAGFPHILKSSNWPVLKTLEILRNPVRIYEADPTPADPRAPTADRSPFGILLPKNPEVSRFGRSIRR